QREAGRDRQAQPGHFMKVRALAAEQIAHFRAAVRLAVAEVVNVFGAHRYSQLWKTETLLDNVWMARAGVQRTECRGQLAVLQLFQINIRDSRAGKPDVHSVANGNGSPRRLFDCDSVFLSPLPPARHCGSRRNSFAPSRLPSAHRAFVNVDTN